MVQVVERPSDSGAARRRFSRAIVTIKPWRSTAISTLSANILGLHRESAALLIGKPQTFPTQLLPQGSVFLLYIFDHILLVSIHSAREDQRQKLEWQLVHQAKSRAAMP